MYGCIHGKEEEDSITLPSKEIYAELENGRRGCKLGGNPENLGNLKQKLEESLKIYSIHDKDLPNKIAQNYCVACNSTGNEGFATLPDNERYSFFFYWLGDKLKGEPQIGNNFSMIMKSIYDKLKEIDSTCNCTHIYPFIKKERFEKAKILFDWFYNYSKLHDQVKCSEYCNNNEKCNTPYKTAQKTYNELSQTCSTEDGELYCTTFYRTKRGQKEYGQPQQLTEQRCPKPAAIPQYYEDNTPYALYNNNNNNNMKECMVTDTNKLPSQKIYDALNAGVGTNCSLNGSKGNNSSQLEEQLKLSLGSYGGDKWDWIDKIPGNYCLTCRGTGREEFATLSSSDRYSFFYYWLGDKVKEESKEDGHFKLVMKAIFEKLQDSMYKCNCKNLYGGIWKERFEKAKTLFDWYYDYGTIEKSGKCNEYCPNKKCNAPFQKALSTYKVLSSTCISEGGELYCEKFKANYQKGGGEFGQPKELECTTVPEAHLGLARTESGVHMKGAKVKGDVDVSLPKLEGDLKGPEVDIKGPKVDINAPDVDSSDSSDHQGSSSSSGGIYFYISRVT
ncbi:KIR protein [Plasmodium coatneyi]|uniref:KIR protein n=1 Tax=Plasmodium coatneyi TaxID=208452 RepID=A0A1B1E6A3_9APIC|nr:KIR protein [Plasmodium coatneyi]ANQ10513.1 KIR protein [Plasmodium coatneyi]